jgi:O-antigen/teichoic acid export membrane protein
VYAAINASTVAIGVVVLPVYARVLPPEAFGAQDLLLALAACVTLVAPLEIAQGLGRHYADANQGDDRSRLASTALWFTISTEVGVVAALLLLGPWLSPWILGPWAASFSWLLVVAFVPVHGLYTLVLSQLRWRLEPFRYAAAALTQVVVVHSIGLPLTAIFGWNFPGLLVGYISGYAVAVALALLASRDDYRWQFDSAVLKRMLTFSVPLVPSSIAIILYSNADRLVLRQVLGLDAVGQFAVLARFAFVIRPLILAASMALIPIVVSRHKEPETPRVVARFSRYVWLGVLTAVLVLAAFGPELMGALVTDVYTSHANLLPLLALAGALAELYILAPGLLISGRTGTIALISVGSAVLNLALNVLLVPLAGVAGACIATALTAAGALVFSITLSQRFYPITYPWLALAGSGAVSFAAAVVAVLIGTSTAAWDWSSLAWRAACGLGGFLGAATWLLLPEIRIRSMTHALRRGHDG